VLTEGVVGYLATDAVAALAAELHARPRIAHWVLEYTSSGFRKLERLMSRRRRKQMTKAPLQFEPGDWRAFFAQRGWTAKEIRFFMPEAERHGRALPVSPWMKLAVRLMTLNHPSVMRENVGFALMERDSVAK
jgi:O-methyltransferase involved in polyketide biosynthesis